MKADGGGGRGGTGSRKGYWAESTLKGGGEPIWGSDNGARKEAEYWGVGRLGSKKTGSVVSQGAQTPKGEVPQGRRIKKKGVELNMKWVRNDYQVNGEVFVSTKSGVGESKGVRKKGEKYCTGGKTVDQRDSDGEDQALSERVESGSLLHSCIGKRSCLAIGCQEGETGLR